MASIIIPVMTKHVAIFSPAGVKQILSGKKTVETRFSQKRIPPFGVVKVGDLIYIKPSGDDIIGQFTVKKVINIEGLEEEDWNLIRKNYKKEISLGSEQEDETYFKNHSVAKFATIIFMGDIEQFITSPIKIQKRDLRGWMVLGD